MKRALPIVVVLGVLGLLGWRVYLKATASAAGLREERRAVAVAVEVAPVQKVTIRDVGQFTGSLLPRSQFIVAPKVPGRLGLNMVGPS